MEKTVRKSYKFRIYPSKSQVTILETTLELCRELYNAALQERRDAWKLERKSINFAEQSKQLPEIKKIREDLAEINASVVQNCLKRLSKTFDNFFSRIQKGEKTGFPRFKNAIRFNSFTYPQVGNSSIRIENNKLNLPKIGKIKLKLSRIILGKVKTCTIKRELDKWFVVFSVETSAETLPKTGRQIGIDVGIENFATLSDGEQIKNPRCFENMQKKLRVAQRRVSRRKKGSNRRHKAVLQLKNIYLKIKNQRADFHHKLSTELVKDFDLIAIEKLNILGMSKGFLAKQIHDVAWGNFFSMLRYKAENADKKLIEVNPAGTSQTCICGETVKKDLSVRQHICSSCSYKNHRDIVSAQVILKYAVGKTAEA